MRVLPVGIDAVLGGDLGQGFVLAQHLLDGLRFKCSKAKRCFRVLLRTVQLKIFFLRQTLDSIK